MLQKNRILRAVVWFRFILFWSVALALVGAAWAQEALPRTVESVLELQVELHRRGFSCGSIDGVPGAQTESALKAFQRSAGIPETGRLDQATRALLPLTAPVVVDYTITAMDLGEVRPVPETWVGKSREPSLAYGNLLELVAERHRANPKFLQRINPEIDWAALLPGAVVKVPVIEEAVFSRPPSALMIRLAARELTLVDDIGRVVGHFPVSIARKVEKRPQGELRITVVVGNPNYTFDPEVFPESAEGKELGRKLLVPPGPNNPVGRAWIGLDRPGYGIHGTPDPEKVGRTESHGCFRLANWDALTLLGLVRVGMVVWVEE
ncbi:MAG: L,D-transpeptidase family protein [Verrucomicrobiota bacterium]